MEIDLFSFAAPVNQPRGTVLLAHGFGEHRGRYARFTEALNNAGYDAWSFDFTGHGNSPGKRARIDVASLISEHLHARKRLLDVARTENIYLFGHSMGGLVTIASTLLNPHYATAVAVTGPGLRPLPATSVRVAKAGAALARLIPSMDSVEIDLSTLSRDPQVIADYEADPLVHHGKVPLLTGSTMVIQGDHVIRNAPMLARPLLILHGEADGLCDIAGSKKFTERTGGVAELVTLPDAYHELLNEPEHEEVTRRILDWYGAW